eukprot:CAMPEP_0172402890 /NCGR_PEP_ID=MMETSP1061-20121228/56581_1 /TAXON_ID=37318 /ORGANISM="Pseudo-nitzschia pungens, Strain cf. pungens" /LENGTH=969 /DNA_ID=CAMNT_0013137055 /DNA_START=76 /DNA_END=2985 /DNA_ORIENTATION=-
MTEEVTPATEDGEVISTSGMEKEVQEEVLENPGLKIDPSLPDPLRYTGASFIPIKDLVPENAWKSTNKDDSFQFDPTSKFDGSLEKTSSEDSEEEPTSSFVINAESTSDGSSSEEEPTSISPSESFVLKATSSSDGSSGSIPLTFKTTLYSFDFKFSLPTDDPREGLKFPEYMLTAEVKGSINDATFGQLKRSTTGFTPVIGVGNDLSFKVDKRPAEDVGIVTGIRIFLSKISASAPAPAPGDEESEEESTDPDPRTLVSVTVRKYAPDDWTTTFLVEEKVADIAENFSDGLSVEKVADNAESFSDDELPVLPNDLSSEGILDLVEPLENKGSPNDQYGFYQKTYASSNFEATFKGFNIQTGDGRERVVPPKFGLMVREVVSGAAPENPKSFSLFFETAKLLDENSYSVYTSTDFGERENGVKLPSGRSIQSTAVLRISLENRVISGYFNDRLIGRTDFTSKVDENNDGMNGNDGASMKREVNSFEIGAVYYAPPVVEYENKKISFSSEVNFSEPPRIDIKDMNFFAIEVYNLSLFYGRYGYGRTINTFTLLPGETTTIEISKTRERTDQSERKDTVFDKASSETSKELENSVEQEQSTSSETSSSDSQSVSASASGGLGAFSFSVSASASQSSSESRQEAARAVASAVEKQASAYSAERTVEANTFSSTKESLNESQSNKRTLQNLNNNRTLNFVFRQLNQEYVSVLHLVDIRIKFLGADDRFRDANLSGLRGLVERYVEKGSVDLVTTGIINKVRFVDNYKDELVDVLVQKQAPPFSKPFNTINFLENGDVKKTKPATVTDRKDALRIAPTIVFNKRLEDDLEITDNVGIRGISGVIIREDKYVLRTEGIGVDAIIGNGDALDQYGRNLQDEDIKEKQANTRILEAKGDLLLLQKELVNSTGNEYARLKFFQNFNFLEPKKDIVKDAGIDYLKWLWFSESWGSYALKAGLLLLVLGGTVFATICFYK